MSAPRTREKPKAQPTDARLVGQVAKQRSLGEIRLKARAFRAAERELVRIIVRARRNGCSLREIAGAADYGSHHRIRELLARHDPAQP